MLRIYSFFHSFLYSHQINQLSMPNAVKVYIAIKCSLIQMCLQKIVVTYMNSLTVLIDSFENALIYLIASKEGYEVAFTDSIPLCFKLKKP